ncbi:hypothetical protein LOOC260_104920 [Paucilactobacillus hokkaidonensis JCM 18461]|uniref:Uncharacterized protein n=2 Tax=Paucilactobacillus hokkaidonensis TaxID=1193095 RepID=A0A0A1GSV9_9LACO|nr:hypothetical protein IV59_GL000133 [Paucilactobacillus hokkaidonensis]BAP85055.1 hypothetical protein LOOC260_104920 [Paucilactobacillus hokkaidonensis JCM 18461]
MARDYEHVASKNEHIKESKQKAQVPLLGQTKAIGLIEIQNLKFNNWLQSRSIFY